MSIPETVTLFAIMLLLAAVPSTSVALVVTRSATAGLGNGMAVAAGVVIGDLAFILLAVFGLSVVAEAIGGVFVAVRYAGAAYLIWLGFSLIKPGQKQQSSNVTGTGSGGLAASFLAGFALTLGDVKALFFYLSLLPTVIDLTALKLADVIVIAVVTVISVGGVKAAYALSATKIASWTDGLKLARVARRAAGSFMIGAGGYMIAKA